jgi:phosphoribosylpyrophosphate synthetase
MAGEKEMYTECHAKITFFPNGEHSVNAETSKFNSRVTVNVSTVEQHNQSL